MLRLQRAGAALAQRHAAARACAETPRLFCVGACAAAAASAAAAVPVAPVRAHARSGLARLPCSAPLSRRPFSSSANDEEDAAALGASTVPTVPQGPTLAEMLADRGHLLSEEEQTALLRSGGVDSIRNFSIIAHIDHGKSTLADRMLELAGNVRTLAKEDAQVLDNLQVERERGITVKAQTASMFYRDVRTGRSYLLNLIDTPGHVDFSYEVSRSLAACQGALLLVDASQGVQAQTLANYYTAADMDLDIVPVLSKIDLPHADPKAVGEEIQVAFDMDPASALPISSKQGLGIRSVFEAIIDRIKPPPSVAPAEGAEATSVPLRALVFDSWFDVHRGVICLVKIVSGALRKHDKIASWHGEQEYDVHEVGLMTGKGQRESDALRTGQVGYVIAGVKTTGEVRLGETFFKVGTRKGTRHQATERNASGGTDNLVTAHLAPPGGRSAIEPLPGFKPARSMVFAGLFPAGNADFEELNTAISKLLLTDPSVSVEKESSQALGLGFRCGFLGVLHMDVFSARLEQEYGAEVIITAPTVPYVAVMTDGTRRKIDAPSKFPEAEEAVNVHHYEEPMVKATIIAPTSYLGDLVDLCNSARGVMEDMSHLTTKRISLRYRLPLAEIVVDFYDRIKTISSGYASFDYDEAGMQECDVVKLDLRLNGEPVDALCVICDRSRAEIRGKRLTAKLKEKIDRQNFEVIIQAAIGTSKIISRERVAPYRKDVLTKSGKTVGGGDVTRKKKLLEKQKAGKKRAKAVGNVELNDEVFASVMKLKDR